MRIALVIVVLAFPLTASAAGGKQLFGRYCASCHGPDGGGQVARPVGGGPAREQRGLRGSGPSLRGVGALAADFYLRTGYMPLRRSDIQPRRSQLLLGPKQIDALVGYVASLGKGPAVPKPQPERGDLSAGQHSFAEHCAGCHQIVGEGGYVTGAVPPSLGDATPVQIAEAVRLGPYVMPAFSQRAIPDRELDSIVRYVRWAQHHPDNRGGWALGHVGPVPEGLVTWFLAAAALVGVCLAIGRRLRGQG
jgi:ubiquinol-cytochrome c reductase cytochrome c subunit